MTPEQIKAAIEALKSNDGAAALTILEQALIDAASGAEEAGETPAGDITTEAALPPAADPMKPTVEKLRKLTGRATFTEAADVIEAALKRLAKFDAESAQLEAGQRVELVAELVKLGVEFPSTAWEGKPEDRKPCKRLSVEPLDDLKARLVTIRAARGVREPTPPPTERGAGERRERKLSKAAEAEIKRRGITRDEFIAEMDAVARRHGADQ